MHSSPSLPPHHLLLAARRPMGKWSQPKTFEGAGRAFGCDVCELGLKYHTRLPRMSHPKSSRVDDLCISQSFAGAKRANLQAGVHSLPVLKGHPELAVVARPHIDALAQLRILLLCQGRPSCKSCCCHPKAPTFQMFGAWHHYSGPSSETSWRQSQSATFLHAWPSTTTFRVDSGYLQLGLIPAQPWFANFRPGSEGHSQ